MLGWMQTAFLVFFGAIAVVVLPGCDSEAAIDLLERTAQAPPPPTASIPGTAADPAMPQPIVRNAPARDRTKLRIATFNIQTFGQAKSERPRTMAVLSDLLTRFDVVAIQEIRVADQSVFPAFIDQVNRTAEANGQASRFDFVVGPRLGRTVSKEQYAFVWDTTRVEILPESIYTLRDTHDDFHREPLVATFQTKSSSGPQPFRATLINIHTDPDEIDWELNRLDDLLRAIAASPAGEDDLILLGDFNADDRNLGELGMMRHITPLLTAQATNTRRTAMYDNIVVNRLYTNEWTGEAGVIDFAADYALTAEEALQVSDHLPVWADFYPTENAGQILASPGMGGSGRVVR